MADWRLHWAKLESGLMTLLEDLPSLPTESRTSVLHYIDHNEYGLAFELLCYSLEQERLPISSADYEMIVNLQTMMGIQNVAETIRGLVDR